MRALRIPTMALLFRVVTRLSSLALTLDPWFPCDPSLVSWETWQHADFLEQMEVQKNRQTYLNRPVSAKELLSKSVSSLSSSVKNCIDRKGIQTEASPALLLSKISLPYSTPIGVLLHVIHRCTAG